MTLEILANAIRQEKGNKQYTDWEEKIKLFICTWHDHLCGKCERMDKKTPGTNKQLQQECWMQG